ncbi:MAG: hypothetical protein ILP14_02670 [Oscillospiraceae bacterium]|nr:hypothetical protein [Oscillospiraceae bacterium]
MMDPQDVTKNIGIRMVFNAAKKRQLSVDVQPECSDDHNLKNPGGQSHPNLISKSCRKRTESLS